MRRILCLAALWAAPGLFPAPLPAQTAVLLADLQSDNPATASLSPTRLTPVGGKLFFLDVSRDLWVTDGTALGTQALAPLCVPTCLGFPDHPFLVTDGRVLYFPSGELRQQLWRSDGTRPGTFRLGPPGLEIDTFVPPVVAGGRLFFAGCLGGDCGLWTSDGSRAGTDRVLPAPTHDPVALVAAGRQAFAILGLNLWRSDGTAAGTVDLGAQPLQQGLVVAGDRVFFRAEDVGGTEVWTSDGTPAGTRALTDFAPDDPFIGRLWLRAIGSRVYFAPDDGLHGQELWVSDGSPAGTRRLTDLAAAEAFRFVQPAALAEVGGRVVFPVREESAEPNLWAVPAGATAARPVRLAGRAPARPSPRPTRPPRAAGWCSGARIPRTAASPGAPTARRRGPSGWVISAPAPAPV